MMRSSGGAVDLMSGEAIASRLKRWFGGARPMVRVLAIDGGGIRGILPALVLAEIERLTGRPTAELFDLVSGTSTGALLGLGLTAPDKNGKPRYKASDVARLYEIGSSRVFSRSVWHQIRAVGNLVDEKYPATGIEEMLGRVFGKIMLSEGLTHTLITCYDVEKRSPFLFSTDSARNGQGRDFPMAQVVRAATAAPTFFEPARLAAAGSTDYHALIDGAVIAYNPALYAYVEARRLFPEAQDFLMVSLGTGQLTRGLPYSEVKNWGAARWAQPLFSLMCDGDAVAVDHQLSEILPSGPNGERRYFRFQALLKHGSDDMDDASAENIAKIKQLGQEVMAKERDTLQLLARTLAEAPAVSSS